nr:hypothetical protein GCM10025732_28660 [Glycomyces mayteni]
MLDDPGGVDGPVAEAGDRGRDVGDPQAEFAVGVARDGVLEGLAGPRVAAERVGPHAGPGGLGEERRVTSTLPSGPVTWQENARWSGVAPVWTVAFGAVPIAFPASSRRITASPMASVLSPRPVPRLRP